MSILNKIMTPVIGLGFALGLASTAEAQLNKSGRRVSLENEATSEVGAVIFRIEDIKPVVNSEGLTEKCSFTVNVYNRMDKEIKEATLDLAWQDEIAGKFKVVDDDVKVVEKAKDAITIISKTVELNNIMPHRQKKFLSMVDTDKCFLLFDPVSYRVTNCVAEGDKLITRNNRQVGGSCMGKFDYINSKNPEYYTEFKDIPESELQKQAEEQKLGDMIVVKEAKDSALKALEQGNKELDKVAKMPQKVEAGDNKDGIAADAKTSEAVKK